MKQVWKTTIIISSLLFSMLFVSAENHNKEEWRNLLDRELTPWRTYLSFEMKDGYDGSHPVDENGNELIPLGYDRNDKNVFSTFEENGETILRISGEIYGCVFTKEDFRNYHLKLKVKWGDLKWEPRLNEPLDSGILYHSQGEAGVDWWRSWMLSHEFQICENTMGEYWTIGPARIKIKARHEGDHLAYDPNGDFIDFGAWTPLYTYCSPLEDRERAKGKWNDLELICYEGKSLHIVNGGVVLAIQQLSYVDAEEEAIKPLDEGRIQLQSEAGEVFYKDILIKPITQLPVEYKQYFE